MKDFELPALEYCTLERACRLLGCELDDILHWAELSAIQLMVKFTHEVESNARITFSDSVDLYKCLRSIDPGDGDFHLSPLSSFCLSADDYGDYEYEGVINPIHSMIEYELECRLSGFWELISFSQEDGLVRVTLLKPFRNKYEWMHDARYWEGSDFSVSDLYISRESIEIISGIKLRVLSSLANFECDGRPSSISEDGNQKTRNYRAMFIKSLLHVCYGKDAADNPRKFLDNPRSKIRMDFEKESISIPSGRAIEGWLKDIDINYR